MPSSRRLLLSALGLAFASSMPLLAQADTQSITTITASPSASATASVSASPTATSVTTPSNLPSTGASAGLPLLAVGLLLVSTFAYIRLGRNPKD